MRIVYWQNILSMLQSATIRALAECSGVDVQLVVSERIPEWRRELGWTEPDFGETDIVVEPTDERIDGLLDRRRSESVHIFSGVSGHPMPSKALRKAVSRDVFFGVQSEASVFKGLLGSLRELRGRVNRARFGEHMGFFLAIGHLAERWYQMIGYPEDKIAPYAYFVEHPDEPSPETVRANEVVELAFIGQLVPRKGLDMLLFALSRIEEMPWRLTVIGDGPYREYYEATTRGLGLSEPVEFVGALENAEAMSVLRGKDRLVLPSRWDGWGAVTNEALIRGVPAIVSDRCGSSTLIADSHSGAVFETGSADSLERTLRSELADGPVTETQQQRLQNRYRTLDGAVAAEYVLDVIDAATTRSEFPKPSWPYTSR